VDEGLGGVDNGSAIDTYDSGGVEQLRLEGSHGTFREREKRGSKGGVALSAAIHG